MHTDPFDLLIRTGRIVSPAEGLDSPGWVAIRGDRIAKVTVGDRAAAIPNARRTLEFADGLLLPGLVDMHAHPALEGSRFGIDPDLHMLPRGTTTVLSQGDAGAGNWPTYREHTIERARSRVRLAINLAAQGESWPDRGSLSDLGAADVHACVAAVESGSDLIWGIAVNVGPGGSGDTDPRELLRRALLAAERTGRPLLYGPRRRPDWSWDQQLELLRAGDVVTYCFSGIGETILDDGRVRSSVRGAQARGVLFDLGHGAASFDFRVAETAIGAGFLPDSISTDTYRRHVGVSPPHDLPLTASKLVAAGMVEADVWPRVTSRPAAYLGLADEIGRLAPGACADLVVLEWRPPPAWLEDTAGNWRPGGWWAPVATVRAGGLVPPSPARE